jgi:hypothetical protein
MQNLHLPPPESSSSKIPVKNGQIWIFLSKHLLDHTRREHVACVICRAAFPCGLPGKCTTAPISMNWVACGPKKTKRMLAEESG